jgi:CBS domain-containing protein
MNCWLYSNKNLVGVITRTDICRLVVANLLVPKSNINPNYNFK